VNVAIGKGRTVLGGPFDSHARLCRRRGFEQEGRNRQADSGKPRKRSRQLPDAGMHRAP
jgi:hypothetical protein